MTTIHIFHTNDFHNHLRPPQIERIKAARAAYPGSLLLDSGDAVSAGNVGVRPGGEPILAAMTDLGYNAMTMGNREFHVADALLRYKIASAGFPILCANMRWKEDRGEALPVRPYVVVGSPVRIAIVGATVPMVTSRMAAKALSAFLFDDPVDTICALAPTLRQEADVVVALTHIGLRQDERLAQACTDIDVIIGGHSHNVIEEPLVVNGTPILQAGWYGHYLGHATVELGAESRPAVADKLIRIKDE